jgi:hypothetical protein
MTVLTSGTTLTMSLVEVEVVTVYPKVLTTVFVNFFSVFSTTSVV